MSADRVRGAFRSQGKSCAMLGSPFMGRLMPLIGARLSDAGSVGERVLHWPGDVGPAAQSVPLRLAGALHGLVLDGVAPGLAAVYPPHEASDDALWEAIEEALEAHEARLHHWLDHAPQTNEVRRAAILLPALWALARATGLPLMLSELGASGGLNLRLDGFALHGPWGVAGPADSPVHLSPDWRGAALPEPASLRIVDRAGVDLNPLDPTDPATALRLRAYIWPDQPHRLALTDGAIALARGAPEKGDAAVWLADRVTRQPEGVLHVVYSTVAWQYFPPETQAACTAAMEATGAAATRTTPLAQLAFETDGQRAGAPLTQRFWDGAGATGAVNTLARADFHGRWVDWCKSGCT